MTTATRTLADIRPLLSPVVFVNVIREAEFKRLPIGHQEQGDGTRSELEASFLALCRRHHLPQPAVNVPVDRYVVDFLWPDGAMIVEVDGWNSHKSRSAFEEDRARDVRLKTLGYEVLRFTWRQIEADAHEIAASIRPRR